MKERGRREKENKRKNHVDVLVSQGSRVQCLLLSSIASLSLSLSPAAGSLTRSRELIDRPPSPVLLPLSLSLSLVPRACVPSLLRLLRLQVAGRRSVRDERLPICLLELHII